jgi:integrative and conjugative element protein (TIGR02256 family)
MSSTPSWFLEPDPNQPTRPLAIRFREARKSNVAVRITEDAAGQLRHYASVRGHWTEEGGCLVGFRPSIHQIVIAAVTGPGKQSKRTATSYLPDHGHDSLAIAALRGQYGQDSSEIGGWHTHPPESGETRPSEADLQLFATHLALVPTGTYVGLILSANKDNRFQVSAWLTSADHNSLVSGTELWHDCLAPAALTIDGGSTRRWDIQ